MSSDEGEYRRTETPARLLNVCFVESGDKTRFNNNDGDDQPMSSDEGEYRKTETPARLWHVCFVKCLEINMVQ